MKHIENINNLPYPAIIQTLFDAHYSASSNLSASSSHWKQQASKFDVEILKSGAIKSLHGVGFGDYQSLRLNKKILEYFTVLTYLAVLPERQGVFRQLKTIKKLDIPLTYDTFRAAAIANVLAQYLPKEQPLLICIIGDGYGVLTSILKSNFPKAKFVLIDLGKVLLFQSVYLQSTFPKSSFDLVESKKDQVGMQSTDFTFLTAENIKDVQFANGSFDLAINVASMQEMLPEWIAFYFTLIRRILKKNGFFYCCNRERKALVGGEVLEYEKFPWLEEDEILFDGEPSFYRWFFSQDLTKNRLKAFNLPIPYGRLFDGKMRHRLVRMAHTP